MKYDDYKKRYAKPARRKPRDEEHRLQSLCVAWFRATYPTLGGVLIAVPNGGRRDAVTGARLKEEGATAGASDLLLLRPNRFYGCLAIEMKTAKGRQSEAQRAWQEAVETQGNRYVVCRSLDEFRAAVTDYMNDK